MKSANPIRVAVLLMIAAAFSITVSAQKFGSRLAPEAVGYRLEQCANGGRAIPQPIDPCDTGSEWITGIVNSNKAHYVEGDSVPYRLIIDGLTPNTATSVSIAWDTSKGGKHAIDYITSYNRTETTAVPCSGLDAAWCNGAGTQSAVTIPLDPNYSAGGPAFPQNSPELLPQYMRIWGGAGASITGFGPYVLNGSYSGDSDTTIQINFNSGAANDGATSTVVISWGGHISRRADWGVGNSATSISGAPFHTRLASGGHRDVQMSLDAVLFPAQIKIVKEVFTINPVGGTSSTFNFMFTSSLNSGLGTFGLVDDDGGPGVDNKVNSNIQSFYVSGNTATEITVTENNYLNTTRPWLLSDLRCVETSGGSQLPSTADSIPQTGGATPGILAARKATIRLQEGEFVTCTFTNTETLSPSAAPATISGRAVNSFGIGIGGARITVTDAQNGNVYTAITNPFGYYTVEGTEVEAFYIMTISHRRYTFADDTRSFTLRDNLTGVDFVANP